MQPKEMLAFRAGLRPVDRMRVVEGMGAEQAETVASMTTEPLRVVGAEVLQSRLDRDVFSERQLQAVMTDFWLNHFSVYARKNQNEPYLLPGYERETILPHALGRFEDLLVAVAKSPAMLVYLDNWESVGPHSAAAGRVRQVQAVRPNGKLAQALPKGINENYARELMELHTLGVNGGYTQADVIEVARCFTGWTIERPFQGGEFVFNGNRHEPGAKTVLGQRIEEGGESEGMQVLHLLATSPATARFVSEKLAVRFVSDEPPRKLVDRMAATFTKTDGDIKAVLTTMFHAPEFWAPEVYRAKVKTPVEFVASAVRASGATVGTTLPLVQALDRLGMPIYGMQTPNGYSWKSEEWVSSNALIGRMNFALALSGNRVMGVRTDWAELLGGAAGGAVVMDAAAERRLELLLLDEPATERTHGTVMAAMAGSAETVAEQGSGGWGLRAGEDGAERPEGHVRRTGAPTSRPGAGMATGPTSMAAMAGLLLGSPEFQRR
jgi:uncharacterized protein (DUF1800 family)